MILNDKRGFEYGVHHFYSPRSGDLASIICEVLNSPPSTATFLISFGSVYVANQRVIDAETKINSGDYLRVHTKPRRFDVENLCEKPSILLDTDDFLVINKPAGLPCHPTVDNLHENILASYSKLLDQKLYVTHRLDTPTSGLLVLAKTLEFQKKFNQLLSDREVQKIYTARLSGNLSAENKLWEHYMEPSPRAPKRLSSTACDSWQQCQLVITKSTPLNSESSLAKIKLLTGRTHQIRAQSSFSGHPVMGDVLYGAPRIYPGEQIDLCATELRFLNHSFSITAAFEI